MKSRPTFSRSAILFSAVLWGTSFPVIKLGLAHVNPYQFALVRFIIAAFLLSGLLRVRGVSIPPHLWRNRFVLVLGVSNAAGFFLQFAGMTLTGATETSLLVNSNFVLVMLVSARIFGERITVRVASALFLSGFGVVLITTGGDTAFMETTGFLGNLLVFTAGLAWVIYIVANKAMVSTDAPAGSIARGDSVGTGNNGSNGRDEGAVDTMILMTAVMILTAIFMAPFSLYLGGLSMNYSPVGWGAILYVSIFCTALPFLLYTHGLRVVGAGASCIMLLLEIVVAGFLSVIFLGESLSAIEIAGAALIACGMVLVSFEHQKVFQGETPAL